MTWTHTTCPYCGTGCGVLARQQIDGTVEVKGDPDHPANKGMLCSKGAALGETTGLGERLLAPTVEGQVVPWADALKTVADGFTKVIGEHGPDAVAFYVSGQLLTEDYYVANKLMKGFIGSANIDTNSRLCMSSSVAGHKRAFGADVVPGCYEDLERADLVIFTGSNAAWCHPVLFRRIAEAKKKRPKMKVVVIDPRRTDTCDIADLHLALKPGSDVALFNGLLAHIPKVKALDPKYINDHTTGIEQALESARAEAPDAETTALACDLSKADVETFFTWFAKTKKTVTLYSQGVNQSVQGTDKVNALLNCHLATGRIGKPGCGPFSLTGQPNAMGGREVGGLSNQLAAHMELENSAHRNLVKHHWQSPTIADTPGLKAVDLFDAVHSGKVKALWVMATNPAVSLPNAGKVREALEKCEFVVVSDCAGKTDTLAYADVALPALAWGEKNGTVTNSERRISRQRSFLPSPKEARADWWIISKVARHMGFGEAFDYSGVADIFREHAALSGLKNDRERAFDISGLQSLDQVAYNELAPIQWPVIDTYPMGHPRLFTKGRFFTPDGKARMLPVKCQHASDSDAYPFILNTGRVRDHWHTMTRTGLSPRLSGHKQEPFVDVCPEDAEVLNLIEGGLVRVESEVGQCLVRVCFNEGQKKGEVFAPIHWTDQFTCDGVIGRLIPPIVDPISGQPNAKQTPIRLTAFTATLQGLLISRDPIDGLDAAYWARRTAKNCHVHVLAADTTEDILASVTLALPIDDAELISYRDVSGGEYRAAWVKGGRLVAGLFLSPNQPAANLSWFESLFSQLQLQPTDRSAILGGQPPSSQTDPGQTICSCMGVGLKTIEAAIADRSVSSIEDIQASLSAGTNCGSCIPELKEILKKATN